MPLKKSGVAQVRAANSLWSLVAGVKLMMGEGRVRQDALFDELGLLELAKQLGNVSQACKMMGYSRDSFYRFKEL
jgi:hypothetical protein